jgi:predicted nucleic acid-binding protein
VGVFVFSNLGYGLGLAATAWNSCIRWVGERFCRSRASLIARQRKSGFATQRTWVESALALLSAALLLVPSTGAQIGKTAEYRAKANFLAAFPNFIEWPAETFPTEQSPLLICVFGDFSFGTSLAEITRGVSIRGHRVEIRWVRKEHELRACQILFVSRSEENHYGEIFKALQGASVLTVGETPDFISSGGAIDFQIAGDKLQFEVNLVAADDARLRISSNMLALASHVVTKADAAKS